MATTTNTPLMNLVVPIPGPLGEPGPKWATDIVNALNLLDAHNHATGSGAKITPSALNINADVTFNSNNLVSVNAARFSSQSSALSGSLNASSAYVVNGDLWFTNLAGVAVQITSGNSINVASLGAITGDYSSTGAALSYNNTTKNYLFIQGTPNTSVVASVTSGSISICEQVSGGQSVTLKTVTGLSTPYTMTFPSALPSNSQPISVDASGIMTAAQITTTQVADQAITLVKLANEVLPAGMIVPFAASTVPNGWLACDGSAVSRTTYSRLFSSIGVTHGYGNNSTTFNLPDYRGRFLRGVDGAATNDPDHSTRTAANTGGATGNAVGSVQGDATKRPTTAFTTDNPGNHTHQTYIADIAGSVGGAGGGALDTNTSTNTGAAGNHTHSITGGGDSETRPKNAYVNFIIKT